MEINRVMILFSGCFLLVWSTYKWKRPYVIWNAKLTKVCSVALGLYNIILAICYEKDLNIALFIVDFILYILLDVGFLTVKLKKDKKGKIYMQAKRGVFADRRFFKRVWYQWNQQSNLLFRTAVQFFFWIWSSYTNVFLIILIHCPGKK